MSDFIFYLEVNGGIKEICNAFFKPEVEKEQDPDELDRMRDAISEFINKCESSLALFNTIAKEPTDERLKTELEKHFANLRTEIQPYSKKPPRGKDKKKKGVKFAAAE